MNPKMNIMLVAALCLSVLVAAFIARSPRYQLVNSSSDVLRLDTRTGEVRRYYTNDKGNHYYVLTQDAQPTP
jgi:hypothetical protein